MKMEEEFRVSAWLQPCGCVGEVQLDRFTGLEERMWREQGMMWPKASKTKNKKTKNKKKMMKKQKRKKRKLEKDDEAEKAEAEEDEEEIVEIEEEERMKRGWIWLSWIGLCVCLWLARVGGESRRGRGRRGRRR